VIVEANASIADAKSKLWRMHTAKASDVAGAGGRKPAYGIEDAKRDRPIERGQVSMGFRRHDHSFGHDGS
jgi:hypothetical protein